MCVCVCVCVFGEVHVCMCVGPCITVESCAHMCANCVHGSAQVEPVTSMHICIHAHIYVRVDTRVFGSARVGGSCGYVCMDTPGRLWVHLLAMWHV